MDNELEIVTNEGIDVAEKATTSQYGSIAAGFAIGALLGGVVVWGVSKLIARHNAKKQIPETTSEPAKDEKES